jgi:molybdate transport system regulatory protein
MNSIDDRPPPATDLAVEVRLPNGGTLSAADIELVETIRSTRSILGASRICGHSYRKTWLMVDALNRTFETRVIATFPGRRGAGAEPTPFGERLVALYRSIVRRSLTASAAALGELTASVDPGFSATARPEVAGADPHRPDPETPERRRSPRT